MNGFRNSSRNGQIWHWQRTESRAVILKVSGRWMEAAEAWRRAAGVTPRTDWQQFARKRAAYYHWRCRGRVQRKKQFSLLQESKG